jgi:hypothetical protein
MREGWFNMTRAVSPAFCRNVGNPAHAPTFDFVTRGSHMASRRPGALAPHAKLASGFFGCASPALSNRSSTLHELNPIRRWPGTRLPCWPFWSARNLDQRVNPGPLCSRHLGGRGFGTRPARRHAAVSRGVGFDRAVKALTFPATAAQFREPNFGLHPAAAAAAKVGCSTRPSTKLYK